MQSQNLLMTAAVILSYMTVWYVIAIFRSRNDLADVAWGPGFVLATGLCMSSVDSPLSWKSWAILALTLIWATRLSSYIFLRNSGKGEDFRYKKWREEWKDSFYWRAYLQVFFLQGCFLFIIGLPIWMSILSPQTAIQNDLLATLGIVLWLIGFLFEAISDYQMASFREQKPHPHAIMRYGLWRYSRHPNYFGESLLWWGIYLIAVSNLAPGWTIVGPLTLTFLLMKVSGVPMLEKKYEGNQEYLDYQRKTPSFFPWFPKK